MQKSNKPPVPFPNQRGQRNQNMQGFKRNQFRKSSGQRKAQNINFRQRSKNRSGHSDESTFTNPNSIYRRYYNKNLKFFLWVIQKEDPPYIFKMHIQAKDTYDLTEPIVVNSIKKAFFDAVGHDIIQKIDVRPFLQKC